MSIEVYIRVHSKPDGMPIGDYYLGGNSTARSMFEKWEQARSMSLGLSVLSIPHSDMEHLINKYQDELYSGNQANDLIDFVKDSSPDDYTYWLVFKWR